MRAMGLQGPIRFASIRRIQFIESVEMDSSDVTTSVVEPAVGADGPTRGVRPNLMEGGRP